MNLKLSALEHENELNETTLPSFVARRPRHLWNSVSWLNGETGALLQSHDEDFDQYLDDSDGKDDEIPMQILTHDTVECRAA